LQHGFIYRHWLNYRHEPDEIQPSASNPADRGFPLPTRTLVYDGYAARHLVEAGHFAADTVCVTGSPALDALVASVARLDAAERARIRAQLDAQAPAHVIVVVTKFTQIRHALPDLLRAVSPLDDVRLVIKPHPAETAEPYIAAAAAAGAANVAIAPPTLDLARLLAVARLLVTVNSTVAIDAISVGVPALIVNLPNNLTPFVDANVMAGSGGASPALGTQIQTLVRDESARAALLARAREFAARHAMQADGRAADRAADAMTRLLDRYNDAECER
jgi:UDP-N-acetylglucosamine 2-epimerase